MSDRPLVITASGMVTAVGLSAPATCAAIRGAIDNVQETSLMDLDGEWILGCEVPLGRGLHGRRKLIRMAAEAIQECIESNTRMVPRDTPLLLCMPEHERMGRMVDDDLRFFTSLSEELGLKFHESSRIISRGHVAAASALEIARQLIYDQKFGYVLISAVDSLLVEETIDFYEDRDRLLTSRNSNGFIPGEAGAAVLVESPTSDCRCCLVCEGLGFGAETSSPDSEEPLRADGLTAAIRGALSDAGWSESALEFRIADLSGEYYYFKETSLAFSRIDRTRREEFDIWHPADCIGETGCAIGVVMLGVLKAACEKNYSKGSHALIHLANDIGERAAMVFSWRKTV